MRKSEWSKKPFKVCCFSFSFYSFSHIHTYMHVWKFLSFLVFFVFFFLRWVLIVSVNFVGIGAFFFGRGKTDSNGVEKRGGGASAPNWPRGRKHCRYGFFFIYLFLFWCLVCHENVVESVWLLWKKGSESKIIEWKFFCFCFWG